jgi:hypothetical protein
MAAPGWAVLGLHSPQAVEGGGERARWKTFVNEAKTADSWRKL